MKQNTKSNLICDFCNKTFKTKRELMLHSKLEIKYEAQLNELKLLLQEKDKEINILKTQLHEKDQDMIEFLKNQLDVSNNIAKTSCDIAQTSINALSLITTRLLINNC